MKDITTILRECGYDIQNDDLFDNICVGDYFYDEAGHKWTVKVKKPRGHELYDDPSNGIYHVVPSGIQKFKGQHLVLCEGEDGLIPCHETSGGYQASKLYHRI